MMKLLVLLMAASAVMASLEQEWSQCQVEGCTSHEECQRLTHRASYCKNFYPFVPPFSCWGCREDDPCCDLRLAESPGDVDPTWGVADHHDDMLDHDGVPWCRNETRGCVTDEECQTFTSVHSYCKNYMPHTPPCVGAVGGNLALMAW